MQRKGSGAIKWRLINTRLQWNSYRITLDPDPRITKEFSMINALHSGEQQDDLPLLTEKAARLRKKALPGPGGCYLQGNLQSEFPHLTGAPILCQPGFISHYLLSPLPPPSSTLSPNKPSWAALGVWKNQFQATGSMSKTSPDTRAGSPTSRRGSLVLSSHFSRAEKSRL